MVGLPLESGVAPRKEVFLFGEWTYSTIAWISPAGSLRSLLNLAATRLALKQCSPLIWTRLHCSAT